MARSIQAGSPIGRLSNYIKHTLRPRRITDVVGLRILSDEDWEKTRAELKKLSKDTLNRLEKSY